MFLTLSGSLADADIPAIITVPKKRFIAPAYANLSNGYVDAISE